MANTFDLYFFANQFRLLELTRLNVPREPGR